MMCGLLEMARKNDDSERDWHIRMTMGFAKSARETHGKVKLWGFESAEIHLVGAELDAWTIWIGAREMAIWLGLVLGKKDGNVFGARGERLVSRERRVEGAAIAACSVGAEIDAGHH